MAFGSSHAVLARNRPLRLYIRLIGVADLHSHVRWKAVRPYIDFSAARTIEVGANTGVMSFEIAVRNPTGEILASEYNQESIATGESIREAIGVSNVVFAPG